MRGATVFHDTSMPMMQLLFSYGTLQQRDVQQATFGRLLHGTADELLGFHQSMVKIEDPDVVRTSGKTHHPIVARTGITPLLDRRPASLSGGEAQRAGIARALLGQPRLLLLDEPLSALDTDARADLLDWLDDLLAEIAIPVFHVTHDHAEAARLAARTIRLRDGRVVLS